MDGAGAAFVSSKTPRLRLIHPVGAPAFTATEELELERSNQPTRRRRRAENPAGKPQTSPLLRLSTLTLCICSPVSVLPIIL